MSIMGCGCGDVGDGGIGDTPLHDTPRGQHEGRRHALEQVAQLLDAAGDLQHQGE